MQSSTCHACSFTLDGDDNFCRRCGTVVSQAQLPALRRAAATASIWRPQASPVVKGAAVMAAGTVGQFVFRRIVGGLFSGGSGARKQRAIRIKNRRGDDGLIDEAQIITETIMMRRVRIRRQA
jgi:hypothetical protein